MSTRLDQISGAFAALPAISITDPFTTDGFVVEGKILVREGDIELPFQVKVFPPYPFQFHDMDPIMFYNSDLLKYGHVNPDGSLCIVTHHSPEIARKIAFDAGGVGHWIRKYYINQEKDKRYEHVSVPIDTKLDKQEFFLFTQTDHRFRDGDHGFFQYSGIAQGAFYRKQANTNIVQLFSINKKDIACGWNQQYTTMNKLPGLFYFSANPPAANGRFAAEYWNELDDFFSQAFFTFLHQQGKILQRNAPASMQIPFLIGYPINENEIHWLATLIQVNDFPTIAQKVLGGGYKGRMKEAPITWARTINCSYDYFFGRGAFHRSITHAKVLIIGIGAVGSMVATSLTRGGATRITLADHDVKEPGNICRSEYVFYTGLVNKTSDLADHLTGISPLLTVGINNDVMDLIKAFIQSLDLKPDVEAYFNSYDLVIDCTGDNDLAYILSQLDIMPKVISLSVSNHATDLICAINKDVYDWQLSVAQKLNEGKEHDYYEPTGCWSPTFKASYNDIAVLVQSTLQRINQNARQSLPDRSFVISRSDDAVHPLQIKTF